VVPEEVYADRNHPRQGLRWSGRSAPRLV